MQTAPNQYSTYIPARYLAVLLCRARALQVTASQPRWVLQSAVSLLAPVIPASSPA